MKLGIGNLPQSDLDDVCNFISPRQEHFKGAKILIFGGTGFIGTWLTSSLLNANMGLSLNLKISLVTRDTNRARSIFGEFSKFINFIEQDLGKGEPECQPIADIVFLGSTPTRISTGSNKHDELLRASINAANFAARIQNPRGIKPQVIHLSSGAIYGFQPVNMKLRSENDPVDHKSLDPYVRAKLLIDDALLGAAAEGLLNFHSPRLFAFAGPLISLDEHFAVGNFMLNGMLKQKIVVKGHPDTLRSYMYPTDLVKCLLAFIGNSIGQPINIGSDVPIKIVDLAKKISLATSKSGVEFTNRRDSPSNYVPSIESQKKFLLESSLITLDESIQKWDQWIKSTNLPTNLEHV